MICIPIWCSLAVVAVASRRVFIAFIRIQIHILPSSGTGKGHGRRHRSHEWPAAGLAGWLVLLLLKYDP